MRILVASDVHYRLRQYDWLYEAAGDVDLVVLAGDLLDIRSAVPVPAQAAAIAAQLARISSRAPVIAASGNHDLDAIDGHGEKVAGWLRAIGAAELYVDNQSLQIGDVTVSAYGWWDGEQGRLELEDRLEKAAQTRSGTWIWVYHSPPSGSPLAWDGRREFGDSQVLDWITRFEPDIVLTGHIHQAPFVEGGGWADRVGRTWLFNAGQQISNVPAHILLDLDAGEATWITATDRATISLDAPLAPVPA